MIDLLVVRDMSTVPASLLESHVIFILDSMFVQSVVLRSDAGGGNRRR